MKVLVCEDDEVVLKLIQLTLQNENFEVFLASDGRQALQYLKGTLEFDLIITDIHMPYHNGDDVLQLVRQEQQKNTPIIMLSSDRAEEVIALALKLGVNDFMVKPIDSFTLLKKVKKVLSR